MHILIIFQIRKKFKHSIFTTVLLGATCFLELTELALMRNHISKFLNINFYNRIIIYESHTAGEGNAPSPWASKTLILLLYDPAKKLEASNCEPKFYNCCELPKIKAGCVFFTALPLGDFRNLLEREIRIELIKVNSSCCPHPNIKLFYRNWKRPLILGWGGSRESNPMNISDMHLRLLVCCAFPFIQSYKISDFLSTNLPNPHELQSSYYRPSRQRKPYLPCLWA